MRDGLEEEMKSHRRTVHEQASKISSLRKTQLDLEAEHSRVQKQMKREHIQKQAQTTRAHRNKLRDERKLFDI